MQLILFCGCLFILIVQVEAAQWLSDDTNDTVSSVNELDNIELNVARRTMPAKRPVLPMINLALGKPTWQSSVWSGAAYSTSNLAVDGNKNKNFHVGKSCTHANGGDSKPWWAVDLGKVTDVYGIELTTISDCCVAFRLDNFIVGLTNNPPSSMSPRDHGYWTCGQYPGKAPEGGHSLFVPCVAGSQPARYVVIMANEHMNICELEVYEAARARTDCPHDFTRLPEVNGCYKPVLSNLEWPIAALRCRSLHKDAHLVFINDANEHEHVRNVLKSLKDSSIKRNLASGQTALQRTTYTGHTGIQYVATFASDGSFNTLSCTGGGTAPPWWAVQLAQPANVKHIKVVNDRNANYPERLDNFYIYLSNTAPTVGQALVGSSLTLCAQYNGRVPLGGTVLITCTAAATQQLFQYVIIQSTQMTSGAAMCLVEVEVYGDSSCGQNNHGVGWWIGAQQATSYSRSFVWRTKPTEYSPANAEDVEMTYTKWQPNEPNAMSFNIPACLCLFRDYGDFGFVDCPCTDQFCALCEIDL